MNFMEKDEQMTQPDYNKVQLNHIRTMYEEAKKEYPRIEHSSFMMIYFRFGGDTNNYYEYRQPVFAG